MNGKSKMLRAASKALGIPITECGLIRRVPVWRHVCMDCGTPLPQAGVCQHCSKVRGSVREVTKVVYVPKLTEVQ
jgi:hypothetical protein